MERVRARFPTTRLRGPWRVPAVHERTERLPRMGVAISRSEK